MNGWGLMAQDPFRDNLCQKIWFLIGLEHPILNNKFYIWFPGKKLFVVYMYTTPCICILQVKELFNAASSNNEVASQIATILGYVSAS